ncbi:hypothetical protein DFH06DRAFT_1326815 [Mycena polygramma]|nr:hypothetical protein DFH06DRAFT_1326815 [Mycena polygramma]
MAQTPPVCPSILPTRLPLSDALSRVFTSKKSSAWCRTVRNNGFLLLWFSPNPADCTRCLKPIVRHRSLPGFGFTILTSCQHGEGDNASEEVFPNKAVAGIMPFQYRPATCLGNLVVVKHPMDTSLPGDASNADLPIVDVEPEDFPFIDELVRRYVSFPFLPTFFSSLVVGAATFTSVLKLSGPQ